MSRFHLLLIGAALTGVLTLALGHPLWLIAMAMAFVILTGLGVAFPQLQLFGRFICRGTNSRHAVALTFDDGPDPLSTPRLLDLLQAAQVKAAFFCVGKRVAANPALAARIVDQGHLLENHSHEHSHLTNFYTCARLRDDLDRAQSAIQRAAGKAPVYFRPPMGLSNPRIFSVATSLGLKVVGWNIRSLDTLQSDPERIVARIRRRLVPGSIILLHDGNIPADRLLATVKSLLDTLRKLKYEVVRVDQLLDEKS